MKLHKIAVLAVAALMSVGAWAQECDINITAVPVFQGDEVPEDVSDMIVTRLTNAAATSGVVGSDNSRFFITAKFNNNFKDVLAGPPQQTAVTTLVTLYIGDVIDRKVFASQSFELKGVGTSDSRAYLNAIKSLNGKNDQFARFIAKGKEKVISYYDANYPQILQKARQAMQMNNYDEALYYSTQIPECSRGYAEAAALTNTIYQAYIDFEGLRLLNQARAACGANPDATGASEAYGYITQINPQAKCYGEAMTLANQIAKVVKANWDFENVTKYKDQISLEKARIKAARDVGVAWGNHQQPITYNVGWLW